MTEAAATTNDGELDVVEKDFEIDFRIVDIDKVEANDYNPNDMEAELFEAIVTAVKEEGGMDQPVLVRPNPDKEGYYVIVDGENRYSAVKLAGLKKLPVVVRPMTLTQAKVRTLSMNGLRGQNIPIKLARLLVDLHKEFSPKQLRAMTGIREDEQVSVMDLLKIPDFSPSDGVRLTAAEVERPIPVSLLLMPDEHGAYTTAMKKAMKLAGDDVVALIGAEVGSYDHAMKTAMGIAGVKLRNVALAVICETFNSIPKEDQKAIVEAAHKKIYDKLEKDAQAKAEKVATTGDTSGLAPA